ncbi:ring-cleaving dioxygenase [Salipaludibacillus neizhouensis]|uniref:Ring-cleaving dioxygenase n=1 Tax=Salipaludibacillus neizhouensis TaxID=885475 RepID=A0A3A9KF91_9BACI|nr:ring-cleaving dioxygenase [Salipaludibacillus neizhouensis]RKL69330.1 ring-cleaving dioxygenase [Salipaludibacillus neizhouensis]
MKSLKGIHHVSALTANAQDNLHFYTEILGMRLVKKTVNQDDTSVYHLFYADERGNPGTDLTFFEIPHAAKNREGTQSISQTALRVSSDETLNYWLERFVEYNVDNSGIQERYGRKVIDFKDFEDQRLQLISDETNSGVEGGIPWEKSPVPQEKGIIGLGPVRLSVPRPEKTHKVLTDVLGFQQHTTYQLNGDEVTVFSTGKGGTGAEVHVHATKDMPRERPGRGSVHHVAFRVESEEELLKWVTHIQSLGYMNSGFVERYYFRSLYFREPNGILFELATDGPGFEGDEPFEKLGENLALPPYFEDQREEIEAKLKPLETK